MGVRDGSFGIKDHLGPETRKAITGLQGIYSASHCKLMLGQNEAREDDQRQKEARDGGVLETCLQPHWAGLPCLCALDLQNNQRAAVARPLFNQPQ